MQRNDYKQEPAFSLIEMSIVLLIIGLIVGGILKGQDLLTSARLKTVISQLNEYRLATNLFYDRFGALPGDFDMAQMMIHPSLKNGNNDGKIDGEGLNGEGEGHEALSFWAHLGAAGLISDPGSASHNGLGKFGRGAPPAKIGGGFTVRHTPEPGMEGHWFLLGSENGSRGDAALLTPEQAHSLDQKMDNGNPLKGKVQARDGRDRSPGACIQNGRYNFQNKKPACILYIQF